MAPTYLKPNPDALIRFMFSKYSDIPAPPSSLSREPNPLHSLQPPDSGVTDHFSSQCSLWMSLGRDPERLQTAAAVDWGGQAHFLFWP